MKLPIHWFAMLLALITPARSAYLTGSLDSHDPSRMIFCNGKYYICSTGGGMKVSTDRISWSSGTSSFSGFSGSRPPSIKAAVPSDQGIWAPDMIFYNNKYFLYYAVASSDGEHCATGLVTSPTLDPSVAGYRWTDAGVVIFTNKPLNYTQPGAGKDGRHFWRLAIQEAANAWTWNNLTTQKWTFAAP